MFFGKFHASCHPLQESTTMPSDTLTLLRTFARQPTKVGAIAPSSRRLADMMVQGIDWHTAKAVIEYGPGTGVFTNRINQCLAPETKFFAIEQSAELAEKTRRRCPGTTVYQDSVTNVVALCERSNLHQVDAILSGLPWAAFSFALQRECFDTMLRVLRPGGQFVTFAYWQGVATPAGKRFQSLLRETFPEVRRSPTVWRNLPPAFVYRCRL
jgi:phosphatidylethanolamine/phosphatidyl-N-methylethanolamine N-methyltransferase